MVATDKQFSQGNLVDDEQSARLAINGRGFFEILLPDGSQAYTRDGTFQINADGAARDVERLHGAARDHDPGRRAVGVTIGVDGVVSAMLPGQADAVQVGTLQLTDFVNPAGLQPRGENLYRRDRVERSAAARHAGLERARLRSMQGSLETSNVNVVEELVSMIETQRAYEMNSRAIETAIRCSST